MPPAQRAPRSCLVSKPKHGASAAAVRPATTAAFTHPAMNRRLPSENASANLCGRTARIGGVRNRKEKKKHRALPARHARKPRKLRC